MHEQLILKKGTPTNLAFARAYYGFSTLETHAVNAARFL